ncbi:MAG: SET domain-containing protein-lysine N-methyltransferase [Mastigocoleus sp.]
MIEVKKIPPKGRGIVATKLIPKKTLIEVAPVSSFPRQQWKYVKQIDIFKYCFVTPLEYKESKAGQGHIVFGLSSLCNHSENPNAFIKWEHNEIGLWAHLIALGDIQSGEEVLIFYTNIDEYPSESNFI